MESGGGRLEVGGEFVGRKVVGVDGRGVGGRGVGGRGVGGGRLGGLEERKGEGLKKREDFVSVPSTASLLASSRLPPSSLSSSLCSSLLLLSPSGLISNHFLLSLLPSASVLLSTSSNTGLVNHIC